jgi:hypothetical protein
LLTKSKKQKQYNKRKQKAKKKAIMKLSNITTLLFLAASAESVTLRGSVVTTEESIRGLSGDSSLIDLEQYFVDRQNQVYADGNSIGYINGHQEVTIKYGEFNLGSLNPIVGDPSSFDCIVYSNKGWERQSFEFATDTSVERAFTASVIKGFKYKQSYTAKVKLPAIAEVSSTAEFEVSLSSTETQSTTTTETLKYTFPLSVPPYTTIEACALISNIYTEPVFEAQIEISNPNPGPYFRIKQGIYPHTVSEHEFGEFFLEKDGFKPTADPNKVIYTLNGKFTGVGGRRAMPSAKYTCLRDDWTQPDGTCRPSSSDGNLTTEMKESPALIEEDTFPEGRSYQEVTLVLNDEGTAVTEKIPVN